MRKENNFENFNLEETKVDFDMDKIFNEEVVESTPNFSETTQIDEPWDYHFEDEIDQDDSSRTVKLHPQNTSLYTKIIFVVIVLLALAALLWLGAKALKIIPGSADKTQSVTVPVVQKLTIQSTESISETTQAETTQASTQEQTTTTRSTGNETTATNSGTVYTVKSGDSLYRIAKAHNVTVAALQSANGSAANNLQPGQTLTIPSSSSASTSTTTATTSASTSTTTATTSAATHTVKAGDTLYSIATKNGLTVAQLKALNGLSSNNVAIGTVLKLK